MAGAAAGSFNITTGTADVVVSGLGITPVCVIFFQSGRTESVNTVGEQTAYPGWGWGLSSTAERATGDWSAFNQTPTTNQGCRSETGVVITTDTTAIDGIGSLKSLDSDGFTIEIDDAFPVDLRVSFLALDSTIVKSSAVGTFQIPAATGNQTITGVGFTPNFCLFGGSGRSTAAPMSNSDIRSAIMVAAGTGSDDQGTCAIVVNDNDTDIQESYCRRGECGTGITISGAEGFIVNAIGTLNTFNSDGFVINWSKVSNANQINFLALDLENVAVGNLLTKTDTTDIVVSGLGFAPDALMFVSATTPEDATDTPRTGARISIGAADSATSRTCQSYYEEFNVSPSDVETAIRFDAIYANLTTAAAIEALMDVKSFDSDGFTNVMDDTESVVAFVWYVAFAQAAAVGTNPAGRLTNSISLTSKVSGILTG